MYELFDCPELVTATGVNTGFDIDIMRHIEKRYKEQLRNKIAKFSQIFELTGGTSTIENWRLKQFILLAGMGAFAPYKDGKLYFVLGNMDGELDHNYLPTKFVFANPHMPDGVSWSGNLEIGKECVLVKNDSTFSGILPILRKHTFTQVQTDLSFYIAIISSRLVNAAVAGRDVEAVAVDLMFKDIEHGNIKAVTDKNVLQQLKAMPYGGNAGVIKAYIEFMQYDKAAECNELGLTANWNAKRESITGAETLLNDDATHPFVDDMFKTWQEWIEEVNEKYGALLDNGPYKLDWASAWKTNEEEQEAAIEAMENNEQPTEENNEEVKEGEEENVKTD